MDETVDVTAARNLAARFFAGTDEEDFRLALRISKLQGEPLYGDDSCTYHFEIDEKLIVVDVHGGES